MREVNFVVNIIDAEYETVDVDANANAFPNFMNSAVESNIIAELTRFLSPATWRLGTLTADMGAGEVSHHHRNLSTRASPAGRQVIRINEIIADVDRVSGVDWVNTATINGAAADHSLATPWTLPLPGAITATAVGGIPDPTTRHPGTPAPPTTCRPPHRSRWAASPPRSTRRPRR